MKQIFEKLFCRHKWEILSEQTTESQLELMVRLQMHGSQFWPQYLERKVIQVCACPKCGELKKFVEKI